MTNDELKTHYAQAVDLRRRAEQSLFEADVAEAQYNAELASVMLDKHVPPGYSVDVYGDGLVKKLEACKKAAEWLIER